MSEIFISVKNLTKKFPTMSKPALQSIHFDLTKGHFIGLVGPDGAGKTTLIRLLAGLMLPTEGSIRVGRYDTVTDAEQLHQNIGYMPQKFGLYEDLSVIQNLILYSDLKGVIKSEREDLFDKLLTFTDLKRFVDRLARDLSGGMKQKLGIACSLLSKPPLVLLDEPSVGVDPLSRRELWWMVKELVHEGITVVWSTSYLDEAEKCDSVILLNEGVMLYEGEPDTFSKRAEGHVFKVHNIKVNRRILLEKVQLDENVIDGLIQGRDLRIIVKDKTTPPFQVEGETTGINFEVSPEPAKFEDAFIFTLETKPLGISELAMKTPAVPKSDKPIIQAIGLTKHFGSFVAANNITFDIHRGEIFGLLGPNGAGKSTTFKMLCGLLKPTSGTSLVDGYNLQTAPGLARSQIGYMAQKFSLYGNLSAYQNLTFFSGIYNLSGKNQKDMIDEMIEVFDLKQYLDTNADDLPLGFKQRLALSCAVMHHPKVLFLDEPTSGVDPIVRREFWCHINGLVEKGITIMVTTHFMEEAEYCDRIALVYRGRVIQAGTPDNLKDIIKSENKSLVTLEDAFIQLITRYNEEE